jgi:peptide deformylase
MSAEQRETVVPDQSQARQLPPPPVNEQLETELSELQNNLSKLAKIHGKQTDALLQREDDIKEKDDTKSSVPPPPPNRPRRNYTWRSLVLVGLIVLLAALVLPLVVPWRDIVSRLTRSQDGDGKRPVIVFPFVERPSTEPCVKVTQEEIRKGEFMRGTILLMDIRASMCYEMNRRNLSGVCAQHFGKPICYCTLNLRRATPSGANPYNPVGAWNDQGSLRVPPPTNPGIAATACQEGEVMDIFNPTITEVSITDKMRNKERSVFCLGSDGRPVEYEATRFQSVRAAYLDLNGVGRETAFNGTHASNIQHAVEIHEGNNHCEGDKTGQILKLMRQWLDNSVIKRRLYGEPVNSAERPRGLPAP